MRRVLIVDDDFIVRTYLKQMLSWESEGYLLQDAKNGQEALEICQKLQPDIVITDMSMPVMNGMDLIKNLKKTYPQINIIVLSCHDDFCYVKEAMKLGVDDYLLKNDLNAETLLEVLNKIVLKYQGKEWGLSKEELVAIGKKKIINDFFIMFDNDKIDNKQLSELVKVANLQIDFKSTVCILIKIHQWQQRKNKYNDEDMQNFYQAFKEMVDNIYQVEMADIDTSYQMFKSHDVENFWGVLIDFKNEYSGVKLNRYVQTFTEKINLFVNRYFNLNISCYISEIGRSLNIVKQHWLNLKYLSDYSFYEKQDIYWELQIPKLKDEISNDVLTFNSELIDLSVKASDEIFHEKIEQYKAFLLVKKFNIKILQQIVNDLEIKMEHQEKLNWENVEDYNSLKTELQNFFIKFRQQNTVKIAHPAIRKALKWIDEHYKEQISQQMVADYVYLNTAYFSNLFSKSMGKTFSEYLMNYRIEKIKKRLRNHNAKIKEIALNEGFVDYQYFCKVFKKITGMNPSEYRQNIK